MKKIKLLLLCTIIAILFASCGDAKPDQIVRVQDTLKQMETLYNEAAPVVAKLDDKSVELYEKAGQVYRSATAATQTGFDGYSEKDLDELLQKINEQIGVLNTLKNSKVPDRPTDKKEGEIYAIQLINLTDVPYTEIKFKSGTGKYDYPVAVGGSFVPGTTVDVTMQCPANETFTISATDENEKEISFSGSFYMMSVKKIALSVEDGHFKVLLDDEIKDMTIASSAVESEEQTDKPTEE